MHRKLLTTLLLFLPLCVQAQIYRCDTPDGPVFADAPCSERAEVVELRDETAGISGGPPEEVRDYLAEKRSQRSEAREAQRKLMASGPRPQQPAIQYAEPVAVYPRFWPSYGRPRPPGIRPPRPERPIEPARPERPVQFLPAPGSINSISGRRGG